MVATGRYKNYAQETIRDLSYLRFITLGLPLSTPMYSGRISASAAALPSDYQY
jgi:hypothetical protein